MNAERLEIARRLVACKGWVWLPGMLRRDPRHPEAWQRIISVSDLSPAGNVRISAACVERSITGALTLPMVCEWVESAGDCFHVPDLDDDLTRLGVLAVVRRAWGDPCATTGKQWARERWGVFVLERPDDAMAREFNGPTEEAALLAALEAAP